MELEQMPRIFMDPHMMVPVAKVEAENPHHWPGKNMPQRPKVIVGNWKGYARLVELPKISNEPKLMRLRFRHHKGVHDMEQRATYLPDGSST